MADVRVSNMSLSDMAPYIAGKKYTSKYKPTDFLTREMFAEFLQLLEENVISKQFFMAYEHYSDFYKTAVDFNKRFPGPLHAELFYAAKMGKYYTGIPSVCVYLVQMAWKEANGMPNLIPKLLPYSLLNECFREGYFLGSACLRDVICNTCVENYTPLSVTNLKNRVGDFTEIYIESTDMVAAVPNRIADALDDKSILNITLGERGLETNGVLLRTMCDYVGAINSHYDLRQLI